MAMGLPSVTTSLCNTALRAPEGRAILVADTAAEFADKIFYLLSNQSEAEKLGQEGRKFVREHYQWSGANEKLEKALKEIL